MSNRGMSYNYDIRAVRYDDIYRMDEIKSLSFHIMFYRGVAKYIVYGRGSQPFASWAPPKLVHCSWGPSAPPQIRLDR